MKSAWKIMSVLLTAVLMLSFLSAYALAEPAEGSNELFSLWNPDAPALQALVAYVEKVTDETSQDYIPPEDRIATFDMDGTLSGELFPTYLEVCMLTHRILADPDYTPDEEMLEFGRLARDHALDKSFPADFDYTFSYHQASAFAGMTLEEYAAWVTRFLERDADGFEGMTYAQAYYKPMVEVVDFLRENGFKCYIVSGSERFLIRSFIKDAFDIPAECMIGSDTALKARNQGDTDGIEYVFEGDDTLVRSDELIIKDLKTNKVVQIAQEIGRQPVLSFGNSSGDVSMNNYALLNNPYPSAAFMLVADDGMRDYGKPEKGEELKQKWEDMGYNVISMREDWKTIYGENVVKTGSFTWLEDYADPATDMLSAYWTEGSEAAGSINGYLQAVTDSASPDYIPPQDRIAVFDLDGTLMCETCPFCFEYMVFADYAINSASSNITDEIRAVAQEILDAAGGEKPDGMSTRQASAGAAAYKGMSMAEVEDMVKRFRENPVWGFSGMTWREAIYKPMAELVNVLLDNEFQVYIVTATERNIVRALVEDVLPIPPSRVIGTEYGYTSTGQGDAADTDYTFQTTDKVVFDGTYQGENAKTSKVDAIVREIGQQPVLAFGNSSGDLAMELYVLADNPYRSASYMVLADDEVREYGDSTGAENKRKSYANMGIGIISMRDDFETIYGDVTKVQPETR